MNVKAARGIRNNNPGNIDYNPVNKWQGQLPVDKSIESRFCRFVSPEYGIRALMKLLQNYNLSGFNTIEKMINRWAPPVENKTHSYIYSVAKALNVKPTDCVNPFDNKTVIELAKAIIFHENGQQPYDDEIFEKAFALL
ncbi:MAG TPA: structural protein [Arsenophonus apicola]|uniref:structural protein n=2 Tax=Arsenophonus apicola TaxID=2879119 RepID=UPI001CDCA3E3|nr:structural protein [Arsenophonus apicola]UBX29536.1 structural protein [Arsenophonus apicola]